MLKFVSSAFALGNTNLAQRQRLALLGAIIGKSHAGNRL